MLQHWCNGAYKADLQMVALHQAPYIFPQTLCKTDRLCWQVQGDKGPSEKSRELHPGVELPPLPTLSVTGEGDTIPISHKGTEDQGPTAPQSSGVFFRLSQKLTNAHVKCLAWLMNDKKGVGKVGGGEEVTPSLPQLLPPLVLPPSRHRVLFIRATVTLPLPHLCITLCCPAHSCGSTDPCTLSRMFCHHQGTFHFRVTLTHRSAKNKFTKHRMVCAQANKCPS